MKTSIIIISLTCLLWLNACKAQQISAINNGKTVKALKDSYMVTINQRGNLIELSNTKNTLPTSGMRPPVKAPTPDTKDSKLDEIKFEAIVKSVFTPERIKKIANDKNVILVNFKTDSYGNLKEVGFVISPSITSITGAEIEKLEQELKKDIHITLNQRIYQGYNYVIVSRFIDFVRLSNSQSKPK